MSPPLRPDAPHARFDDLEQAAFKAWPSQDEVDVDGWRLRLDSGYTKRANSANATSAAEPLTGADVDAMEDRFRQRGLTPVFRLPSFAPVAVSDAMLADRGYTRIEPSFVMVLREPDAARVAQVSADAGVASNDWPTDARSWLRAFHAVTGASLSDESSHLRILQRITHPCAWAVDSASDAPRSCGLGVLVDGRLGLFDIATRADRRRQGLGERLCRDLLAWSARRGARAAFLQVTASNATAVRLYERLGFEVAYEYWYRVREA